jgi:hypothetical protein
VKTLIERLTYAMKETGLKRATWAREARLHRETVRQIFLRAKKSPDATIELDTAEKLASVTPFAAEWLAFGRGEKIRRPSVVVDDPKYPTRTKAVVAARAMDKRESAIQYALSISDLPSDPGEDYWFDLIKLKHLEHAKAPPAAPIAR